MSDEVNAIINNLCDKLGTSANLLIPELAKLRIAETVILLVAFALVLAVGIIFFKKSYKFGKDEDAVIAYAIIGLTLSIFGFSLCVIELYTLVGWLVSPRAKAILEIIRMVRG